MQVSVKTTKGLSREMSVEVPAEKYEVAFDQRIQSILKTMKVDGFRKGKVPLRIVRQRYGASVTQEVLQDIVRDSYMQAVQKENLNPVGMPHFHTEPVEKGKDIAFTAHFEVYPEVQVANVTQLQVERVVTELSDQDIDKVLTHMPEQYAEWDTVERTAKEGDQVIIDFMGMLDGKPFEGGKAEKYPLELGSNSMIPGFEENIIGVKVGEQRDIEATFPEDYQNTELAGKQAAFNITVHEVKEKSLPEVNDAFAIKILDRDDAVVADLRNDVAEHLNRERDQLIKNVRKTYVIDALIKAHDFDLPNTLIDHEIESMAKAAMQRMGMAAENIDSIDSSKLPREPFEEEARRRVTLGLLLSEIIKENDIKADADRVRETIQQAAATYEKPEEVEKYYHTNPQMLQNIQKLVIEDQVVDWVLENAKVTDKEMSFDDLMSENQAQAGQTI